MRWLGWGALACCAGFARAQLATPLTPDTVQVEIGHEPAAAPVRTEVNIRAAGQGARVLEVTVTNASDRDIALGAMTVRVPWLAGSRTGVQLAVGGWDMGRTETRVVAAEAGAKVDTETFVMARRGNEIAHVGFVTWRRFTSHLALTDDGVQVRADGERRRLRAGESILLEKLRFADATDWQDALFDYADAIARENKIRLNPRRRFVGWSTWDFYHRDWTVSDVTANVEKLLTLCPQANLVQIDGGWWPERGDYLGWRKALNPDGMKGLAQMIRAKGLMAGIHLDGMRSETVSQVSRDHPDYFLRDAEGRFIVDANPSRDAVEYLFFDYSNPGARDYLRRALTQIRRDWGFDYIKIDFLRYGLAESLPARAIAGHRPAPFDPALTSVERFHLAMDAFRRGMGADAYFLGCSAIFGPAFGHVDGLRTGADIKTNFQHFKATAVDNSGNFYLNGKVVHTDADYLVMRTSNARDATPATPPPRGSLTFNEAEMWAHYAGLFGGPKLESDNLTALAPDRVRLFQSVAALPTCDRFVPIDFWAHARAADDPPAIILGEAEGVVHLAVFNWTDRPAEYRLRGFAAEEARGLVRLGGTGEVGVDSAKVNVKLEPRHSMIFRADGGRFDVLRKKLVLE